MYTSRILSKKDCEQIHSGSMEILSTLGVKIEHEIVFKKMLEAGAKVIDEKNMVAAIPEAMVKKALETAPKKIKFADRRGAPVETFPGGPDLFWGSNAMFLAEGKKRRLIDPKDFENIVRIYDALDNVYAALGANINGCPPFSRDFFSFRMMLENTNKHLRPVVFGPKGAEVIMEMAHIALDGKSMAENPIFSLGYSIVSPLHWGPTCMEMYLKSSGHKIPMTVNGEPLAGGTAPVTLAGAITLSNAEILSGITILQVLEKGRPSIYNLGFAHVIDMKSAISLSGSAECALLAGAGANLAEFYNLPCASWVSTESMVADEQAVMEKTLCAFSHISNGVNVIWGVGQLESQLTFSLEQAVMDNEAIGQLKRVRRGIEVNKESIALDLIKQVGLAGDFLSTEHTLDNFKKELVFPELVFRGKRDSWDNAGSKDLLEMAEAKVKEILTRKQENYLPSVIREKILKVEKKWIEKLG